MGYVEIWTNGRLVQYARVPYGYTSVTWARYFNAMPSNIDNFHAIAI